jgi:hypothetical protein
MYGKGEGVYSISVEKPEGKRKLRRTRCRWENNIKMSQNHATRAWTVFL